MFSRFYEGEGSLSNDNITENIFRISISQNDGTPLDIGQKIWGNMLEKELDFVDPSGKKETWKN